MHHGWMGILVLIAGLTVTSDAGAQGWGSYPYCMAGSIPDDNCAYSSMQQCLWSARGVGGRCYENPRFGRAVRGVPRARRDVRGRYGW